MKLPRRKFLHLAAGAAAVPAVARIAMAQAYPARPVRIVVGFPPGGGADITARAAVGDAGYRVPSPLFAGSEARADRCFSPRLSRKVPFDARDGGLGPCIRAGERWHDRHRAPGRWEI